MSKVEEKPSPAKVTARMIYSIWRKLYSKKLSGVGGSVFSGVGGKVLPASIIAIKPRIKVSDFMDFWDVEMVRVHCKDSNPKVNRKNIIFQKKRFPLTENYLKEHATMLVACSK